MRGIKSMHRLQYDTESRELAQCCGHGVFTVAAPQLHRPAGAEDQPALPYNWAGGRNMFLAGASSDIKYFAGGADPCSWVSLFLWVPSQNSAMMLSHQTTCIQT